ncbi:hypothetical protein USDA257_c14680 [Sinorhizobium fredii USDA 257]|uniref:Uncharacterized protein n=1 Tax=Sinorhizobium fredii (strain USDA 257) TaxID=1185652 RepID=I3X2F2_SINF2|nr:hypothetical protein USDA257_c14680 [Sinorhizobium fredii USDA 257]
MRFDCENWTEFLNKKETTFFVGAPPGAQWLDRAQFIWGA